MCQGYNSAQNCWGWIQVFNKKPFLLGGQVE